MDKETQENGPQLPTGPISLTKLNSILADNTIENTYAWLGFDYAQLASMPPDTSTPASTGFSKKFNWKRQPTTDELYRIFNQINSYYADAWVIKNAHVPPLVALTQLNNIVLFKQNKNLGTRKKQIEFGVRSHLDFMDPRRRDQWLRGLPTQVLEPGLQEWAKAIDTCPRTFDHALLMSLIILAIHPFSDGNGRCGREIFIWLLNRWNLPLVWLNEASNGEFLRTGDGIHSTEYLMAQMLIKIMDGSNDVSPGENRTIPQGIPEKMLNALTETLRDLTSDNSKILTSPEYTALKEHFEKNGHIVSESPRLKSLQDFIS